MRRGVVASVVTIAVAVVAVCVGVGKVSPPPVGTVVLDATKQQEGMEVITSNTLKSPPALPAHVGGWSEMTMVLMQPTQPPAVGTHLRYTRGEAGVLDAVIAAYNMHLRLVLNPDVVWATVVNSLSVYIDVNAETLRSLLVPHDGKKQLVVKMYDDGDVIHWPDVVEAMVAMIHKDALPAGAAVVDAVRPAFSTTDATSRLVCAVATMAGFRAFYGYTFKPTCGIPAVTFEGTREDWHMLRARVAALCTLQIADAALRAWLARLDVTLGRIVDTADAAFAGVSLPEELRVWWSHVYSIKRSYACGVSDTVSGWVLDLFMYKADGSLMQPGDQVETEFLPSSWVQVPVVLESNTGKRRDLVLVAGSWDAVVDVAQGTVRPRVKVTVRG